MDNYNLAYISEEKLTGFAASEARLLRWRAKAPPKALLRF